MQADRDPQLERIVEDVLALPQAERQSFVEHSVPSDLRDAVLRALEQAQSLGHFLEPRLSAGRFAQRDTRAAPEDWPSLLAPGEQLGEYVVESLHAVGGMSEIYRAHGGAGAPGAVALKVWHTSLDRVPDLGDGAMHPHLVRLLAAGRDIERELSWVAMRFVEGPSLQELLEQIAARNLAPSAHERRALVQRFVEVCRALAAMHVQGHLHRDVKPANILFACQRQEWSLEQPVVLVDLVPASAADGAVLSTVFATQAYAAPEVLLGLGADARADVFGLGVTMHDVLAGRLPRERGKRPAAGLEPLVTLGVGIDADLSAVVQQATDPQAPWRYQGAAALAEDLEAWLLQRPPTARPRSLVLRAWRSWQRNPGATLARSTKLLALLLVLGLVLAGLAWTAEITRAARAVAASWANGDLIAVRANYAQVPVALQGLLLPGALTALTGSGEQNALATVLRQSQDQGPSSALLQAARYLARDGPAAHADLVRWFTFNLEHEEAPWLLQSAQLAARLFLDRPPNGAAEQQAYAALRLAIERRVASMPQSEILLPCIAALGGCGGMQALGVLTDLVEWNVQRGADDAVETVRLAVTALHRIGGRLLAEQATAPALLEALDAFLQRTAAAALRLDRSVPGSLDQLAPWLEDWFVALACAHRRLGVQGPPSIDALRAAPAVRAAVRDPRLADELRAGRSFLPQRELARRTLPLLDHSYDYYVHGYVTGLLDMPTLESELEDRVLAVAAAHGAPPAFCRDLFHEGLRDAHDEVHGLSSRWRTDEQSRLGSWFEMQRAELVAVPLQRREPERRTVAADFDMDPAIVAAAGGAQAMATRAAQFHCDDFHAERHYAWLGVPGVSALRFTFAIEPRPNPVVQLRIELQMAARPALPYQGDAGIDILLDGVVVNEVRALLGVTAQDVRVPLCRATAARQHELEIRLRPETTTTVRIFRVTCES